MSILSQLRSAILTSTIQEGSVVAISDEAVTIATTTGSYLAHRQSGDVTKYQVGDAVSVNQGFLTGVSTPASKSLRYVIR